MKIRRVIIYIILLLIFPIKAFSINQGATNFLGNVGIGTSSPLDMLDVKGTLNRFTVSAGGNVGIGTNVVGAGEALEIENGSVFSGQGVQWTLLNNLTMATPNTYQYATSNINLHVPIGTSTQSCTILAQGINDVSDSQGYFAIDQADQNCNYQAQIAQYTYPTGQWQFFDSNNPTLTMNANNNVGIGSVNPGQVLDVKGTIRSSLGYVTNGNVGIGTSNPIMPLDVVGTLQPFVVAINGNVGIGTWVPNASLQIGTGTNSCTSGNNCFGGNVGIGSVTPGLALDVNGTVRMSLGNTLSVVSGTNGCAGQATLLGGVSTVSTTCTPNTSIGIFLTDAETSLTNVGSVCIATVTAGSSFVIQSTNASDASKVNWEIHKTT